MQATAIEALYAGNVETLVPENARERRLEADYLRSTPHVLDPHLEDAWFSRGETELAVQIVAIDRDPTDGIYLPEARSYRMPIAVGVMLASMVTALLVMF